MSIFSALSVVIAKALGKEEEQDPPKDALFEDFDATMERLKNFELEQPSGSQRSLEEFSQGKNFTQSRSRQP